MEQERSLPGRRQLRENKPSVSDITTDPTCGLPLGRLYKTPHQPSTTPFVVDQKLARRHIAHLANTGAGKTTTAQIACLNNSIATDGLDFVIDPKGGFADELAPMLYAKTGSLDRLTVIPAAEALPKIPLLDLRPYLAIDDLNVSRDRLIQLVVDATIAVLADAATTKSGFQEAAQSVDLLRSLMTALFQSGLDHIALEDLVGELHRLAEGTASIGVSDPRFQAILDRAVDESPKMRRALAGGATRRLGPLLRDPLTADSLATPPTDVAEQFNFYKLLDSDELIVFDTAALGSERRQRLARVIISRFFIAGRLRQRSPHDTHPLANLYIDEAHAFGDTQILLDILSEGRAFDISLYLMSQMLSQFGTEAKQHISGNIGTLIAGGSDWETAQAVLDYRYSQTEAKRITATVPDADWIVRTRAPRGVIPFDPFVIAAPTLPRGHPDSEMEFQAGEQAACDAEVRSMQERSAARSDVVTSTDVEHRGGLTASEISRGLRHTLWIADLPSGLRYDAQVDAIRSTDESINLTFAPTFSGVCEAVRTCYKNKTPADLSLPVTDIGLTEVSPQHVQTAPVTVKQLMFLRLIEKAQRRAIDDRAWDVRTETMLPLRNEVGCSATDEAFLKEQGYISLQGDLKGKYFHLTNEGRSLLRNLRSGQDPAEIKRGDTNESVVHIKGVELAAAALESLAQDPSSPVHTVKRYWSPPDARKTLDLVALDHENSPVVTVEVERPTNDHKHAVPADYEAMASCDPMAAVWLVPNRKTGHRVVDALTNADPTQSCIPLDPAEVKAETTPLDRYSITAPGCTAIRTFSAISTSLFREQIAEP